jgi:hypothetical protein
MTKRRPKHHPAASAAAVKEEHSEPQLSPSKPGFSKEEALELLAISTVANFLGPVTFSPFPIGVKAASDPANPLPNDDGRTYPYPLSPIWPQGWAPGVVSDDPELPWQSSILTSKLSNGVGVNSALVAYNSEREAYAIAFAGTLNPGGAMEDIAGILIPAGPVNLGYFQSSETYARPLLDVPVAPFGGKIADPVPEPLPQLPMVHLGYREAVESLSVGPLVPYNLAAVLKSLPGDEINLYVTGHSLGAAAAQLFSAWIAAGGVPSKKIHVKCYSFATPKSCNAAMAFHYDIVLSNAGFSYRVNNSLDTAGQLPPTQETAADLINPAISADVLSKAAPSDLYAASPLAPIVKMILNSGAIPNSESHSEPGRDPIPFPFSIPFHLFNNFLKAASHPASPPGSMAFVGMGTPYTLAASSPVVYNGRCYPPEFFPGRTPEDLVPIPDTTTREWWQHWPFNYAKYLTEDADLE